jgi:hypothetical protein
MSFSMLAIGNQQLRVTWSCQLREPYGLDTDYTKVVPKDCIRVTCRVNCRLSPTAACKYVSPFYFTRAASCLARGSWYIGTNRRLGYLGRVRGILSQERGRPRSNWCMMGVTKTPCITIELRTAKQTVTQRIVAPSNSACPSANAR